MAIEEKMVMVGLWTLDFGLVVSTWQWQMAAVNVRWRDLAGEHPDLP